MPEMVVRQTALDRKYIYEKKSDMGLSTGRACEILETNNSKERKILLEIHGITW